MYHLIKFEKKNRIQKNDNKTNDMMTLTFFVQIIFDKTDESKMVNNYPIVNALLY